MELSEGVFQLPSTGTTTTTAGLMPFPNDASYASEFMQAITHQQRHKANIAAAATTSSSQAGYAVPQVSRVLQLDSARIDISLHKILERLSLALFEVEGSGGSGMVEFTEVPDADLPLFGGPTHTTAPIHTLHDVNRGDATANPPSSLVSSWMQLVSTTIPLLRTTYQEELVLLLRAVLYKFTVWDRHATLGDRTQNLCFRSEGAVWTEYWLSRWGASKSSGTTTIDGVVSAASTTSTTSPPLTTQIAARVLAFGNTILGITPRGLPASEPAALVDVPNYRPSLVLKVLYAVLSILLPYLYARLRRRVTQARHAHLDNDNNGGSDDDEVISPIVVEQRRRTQARYEKALSILEKGEKIWAAAEYVNLVLFLAYGRFRLLLDRVLGLRLVSGNQKMAPFVAMQLMNEEIVSHAWFEFLTFAGSIASGIASRGSRLDRMVLRPARRALGTTASVMGVDAMFGFDRSQQQQQTGSSSSGPQGDGRLEMIRNRCGLCNASPIAIPRQSSTCPHVFCYYCAEVAMRRAGGTTLPQQASANAMFRDENEEEPYFRCPACGEEVRSVGPLPP